MTFNWGTMMGTVMSLGNWENESRWGTWTDIQPMAYYEEDPKHYFTIELTFSLYDGDIFSPPIYEENPQTWVHQDRDNIVFTFSNGEEIPLDATAGCTDATACNYDPDAEAGNPSVYCEYPLGLTTCYRDVDGNGYHELVEEINIDDCDINSCEDLGSEYATSYSTDGGGCGNDPVLTPTRGQSNMPPRIVNDSRYTNNRMVGDCNGDGWIDIHDINEVANMISTNRYDVCADTMNRNTIDKQDLINVIQHVSHQLPHNIDTMSIQDIKEWVNRQDRRNGVYTMGLMVNTIA